MSASPATTERKEGLLTPLRHPDFRRVLLAFGVSASGTWAYNVALTVWLLDRTDSPGWVAGATVARFVPALVMTAYSGILADRFERVRVMRTLDVILTVVMLGLGGAMLADADPALVVLIAALASTIATAYEPAAAALTPLLVPERDLGSANALRNTVDNLTVVAGPALGGLLVLVADPWTVVMINAVSYVASFLLLAAVRTRSTPVDVSEGGEAGPVTQMMVGIRALFGAGAASTLLVFALVDTLIFGVDTVMLVVMSDRLFGTGAEGYGYLLAGLGLGGILAAGIVARLERSAPVTPVILGGMALTCLPTLLFLTVHDPAVAFVAQCIRGAGVLAVDVVAISALQRSVSSERLGRVFGALDSMVLIAILIGSSVTPWWIAHLGLTSLIWTTGLAVPALCLLGLPALLVIDRAAAARRAALAPRIELIEGVRLFEAASTGAVEQLADAASDLDVVAGQVVVTQGEAADAFYLIAEGSFAVRIGTEEIGVLAAGEGFGELGLIERMPRTASVIARTDGRLLRIEGEDFLAALTQEAPSVAFLDGAAARLRRSQPEYQPTQAGLTPTE